MDKPEKIRSMAWLLRGISSVPGELRLEKDRLSYKAFGFGTFWRFQLERLERDSGQNGLAEKLDNGETALVFDVPVSEARVHFPWYYFSGGLVIRTGGSIYKFSFGRPANTGSSLANKDISRVMNEIRTAGDMRKIGKLWRNTLNL